MSIIPYNNNKDVLYHNPDDGILVVHDPQENTIRLLSTLTPESRTESSNGNHGRARQNSQSYTTGEQYSHTSGMTKCPNCGFTWSEYTNVRPRRSSTHSQPSLFNVSLPQEYLSQAFIHTDYFKLLGKLPCNEEKPAKQSLRNTLPDGIFNQGNPYILGSGAHAQVYKVNHVLNEINLGTYAVKRINVGDQLEFLDQVLNEVLILYELSTTGANENNLIRYNHVWLEMGELDDSSAYFLPSPGSDDRNKQTTTVPYVFILQQYCDGGHLEDLIKDNFTVEDNLTWKEKVEMERQKRRAEKKANHPDTEEQWLSSFEIWKFFHDVTTAVNFLHSKGILHRDIKSSNCLLDEKYVKKHVKQHFESLEEFESQVFELPKVLVSDFGEGKFLEKRHNIALEKLTDRRGNTGTLEFTAPELWLYSNDPALGNDSKKFFNDFTYASDIYSLGLILCYLCIGKLPFSGIIKDENDPQVARDKILEWYYALTYETFAEWFENAIIERKGHVDDCMKDFEKLVYKMIKGDDTENRDDGGSSRISAKDVLVCLSEMKWKHFVKSDLERTRTYSGGNNDGKSCNKLVLDKRDEQLAIYNPKIGNNSLVLTNNYKELDSAIASDDDDDDDEDYEYEEFSNADHMDLTEDELEDEYDDDIRDFLGQSQSEYFQLNKFATVPFYCFELALLEYLSFYSPSFSKLALKLCIFLSIGLDLLVVERTQYRTGMFVLCSIGLSIFLAYEIGHPTIIIE
ncbi:IKS1 Probable serine/threonine-protein kinase IKS1 [Candida maltosa Xu316]